MPVIAHASLVEFFKEQVEGAMAQQGVPAPEATACYVVHLLSDAMRSDSDGPAAALSDSRPLALRLAAALDERCPHPSRALRQVADAALLAGGFFAPRGGTATYYRTLGGFAYGALVQESAVLGPIFSDLAERFALYADVLGEVGQRAAMQAPAGLVRALAFWERNGHVVTERLLLERGMVLPRRGTSMRVQ
ncbi:MAG: hypothetical protein H0V80_04500 [Acidobacteria bacterium]|nr:hypothetical protein [Acidobacteriota bacterium]